MQGLIEGNSREQWVAIRNNLETKNLYAVLHSSSDKRLKKDLKPLFYYGRDSRLRGKDKLRGKGKLHGKDKLPGKDKLRGKNKPRGKDKKDVSVFLERLNSLKAYSFKWKDTASDKKSKKHFGFIAQDVQKIIPEVVEKDRKGFLTIRYTELIPLIVSAFQEFQENVTELFTEMVNDTARELKEVKDRISETARNTANEFKKVKQHLSNIKYIIDLQSKSIESLYKGMERRDKVMLEMKEIIEQTKAENTKLKILVTKQGGMITELKTRVDILEKPIKK